MGYMHMGQSGGSDSNASGTANSKIDMTMASFLTKDFAYRPVVFEKLYARNKREAFGIFVLILATTFVYKLLLFVSWSLEVHWFKVWHSSRKRDNSKNNDDRSYYSYSYDNDDDLSSTYSDLEPLGSRVLPKVPSLLHEIFVPTWESITQDLIRILLTFTSTLLIYILMLTTMTYVVPYLFGVVTGLSLCEVFFNKCKLNLLKKWEIEKQLERQRNCRKCTGPESGTCSAYQTKSRVKLQKVKTNGSNSSAATKTEGNGDILVRSLQDPKGKEFVDFTEEVIESNCCCGEETDGNTGTSMAEIPNLQSQTDEMDPNLNPQVKI